MSCLQGLDFCGLGEAGVPKPKKPKPSVAPPLPTPPTPVDASSFPKWLPYGVAGVGLAVVIGLLVTTKGSK